MNEIDTKLRNFGINPEKAREYQVLCLPENFESAKMIDELYDTSDSVNLCKLLKNEGFKCANSFDFGIDTKFRIRKGIDLYLGSLLILDKLVIPFIISVVAHKFLQKLGQVSPDLNKEQIIIQVNFIVLKDGNFVVEEFKGDSTELEQKLGEIYKHFTNQK